MNRFAFPSSRAVVWTPPPVPRTNRQRCDDRIREAWDESGEHVTRAAQILGMPRGSLYYHLKRLTLTPHAAGYREREGRDNPNYRGT